MMDFDFDDDELSAYLNEEMGTDKKQGHSPLSGSHDGSISDSSRSNLVKSHNSDSKTVDSAILNSKANMTLVKEKAHSHSYRAPNSILKQHKPPVEQQRYGKPVQSFDEIPLSRRSEKTRDSGDNDRVRPEDILQSYLPSSRQKKQSWAVPENTNGKRKVGEINQLQHSPSSSSVGSSNSNHRSDAPYRGRPKRRKAIPGPVGIFKASLNKSAKKALRSKEMVVSRIAATQDSIFDSSSSDKIIDEYSDFRQGPWLKFCYRFMVRPPMAPASYIPPKTIARGSAPKYIDFSTIKESKVYLKGKVAFTAGIIESFKENFESGKVLLKDPTGTMKGSLGGDAVNEYAMKLTPGTILVLKDIAMFTPAPNTFYLNITLKNIQSVIPANVQVPKEMLAVSTMSPPSQDSCGGSNRSNLNSEERSTRGHTIKNAATTSISQKNQVKDIPSNSRDRHSLGRSYPKENFHEDHRREKGRSSASLPKKISNSSSSVARTALGSGTNTSVAPRGISGRSTSLNDSRETKTSSLISKENLDELCAGVDFDSFADDNWL